MYAKMSLEMRLKTFGDISLEDIFWEMSKYKSSDLLGLFLAVSIDIVAWWWKIHDKKAARYCETRRPLLPIFNHVST